MDILIYFLSFLKSFPAESSLILVSFSVFVLIILQNRKLNLEGVTSVSKLQNENIAVLIRQNRVLSEDLLAIRKQLSDSYEQIDRLHIQVSELRKQIMQLEADITEPREPTEDTTGQLCLNFTP